LASELVADIMAEIMALVSSYLMLMFPFHPVRRKWDLAYMDTIAHSAEVLDVSEDLHTVRKWPRRS